jgi:hypothetical protein
MRFAEQLGARQWLLAGPCFAFPIRMRICARPVFTILLILCLALLPAQLLKAEAETLPSTSSAEIQPLAEQTSALAREINRQADLVFARLALEPGAPNYGPIKHIQRAATYRLKQMHVLTDIMKAAGPSPAIAIVATEVVTDFILAPVFMAIGRPVLAGAMVVIPWGMVAGAGVMAYQVTKLRRAISSELGGVSLSELDRIRKVITGYDLKHRVSSVIFKAASEEMSEDKKTFEIEVLKKLNGSPSRSHVTVSELVNLVQSRPGGKEFLGRIYFERLDQALYAELLLRTINEDPVLLTQFLSLLKARDISEADRFPELRRLLLIIDDLRDQVDRQLKQTQLEKSLLKKALKLKKLNRDEFKQGKDFLNSEFARMSDVRLSIIREEYRLLLLVKNADQDRVEIDRAVRSFAPMLEELRSASELRVQTRLEDRVMPPAGFKGGFCEAHFAF